MPECVKYCPKCGIIKNVTEFGKHKNRYDGLQVWCKCCTSDYHRIRRADPVVRDRQSAYLREWYIAHRHEILEQDKYYYIENKESRLEYSRQYYADNRDKIKKRNQEYYAIYGDKKRKRNRQYHADHPEKTREKARRRNSRKRELSFNFTSDDENFALKYWNNTCAFCGDELDLTPASRGHAKWAFDHWIAQSDLREDNPGTVPWNMIPICHGIGSCNLAKGASDPVEWLHKRYSKEQAEKILEKIYSYFNAVEETNNVFEQ